MTNQSHPRLELERLLGAVSAGAAIATLSIGCLVLAGWLFDVAVLKSFHPDLVSMKAITAAGFVLTGLSLWLSQSKRAHVPAARYGAWASAAVVAALGLLTLAEYVFGWNLGFDQLFFTEPAATVLTFHPGRMAPNTAFNFLLLGLALLLLDARTRGGHRPAQYLIGLGGFIAVVALVGYLYDASALYSPSRSATPMSVPAALAGIFAFVGLWLARPAPVLLTMLAGENAGSRAARHYLVPILLLPVLLEVVLLAGQRAGLYGEHLAAAVQLVSMTAIFLWLVLAAAGSLNRAETELAALRGAPGGSPSPGSPPPGQDSTATGVYPPDVRRPRWLPYVVAIALAATAALVRLGFLQMLGTRATYITFYPAVILAALYGGLPAGLLATILAGALADYFWLEPVGFGISDPANWLSLAIFLVSGTMVSVIAEAMHRAQARANRAETQATLAAVRKQDLETMRQQREWLHVTLSSIGDAVLATDTAGCITFLNPVAETLTGWKGKEVVGQPVRNVFRIINEDTRAPGEDIFARVLREGRIVALANHTALVTRDGREVPIEDSAAPIRDSAGTVSGVVLVFHDVTEKRRAQAAMRESQRQNEFLASVIEHSSQAFGMGYPDGRLGLINRAFEQLTGYSGEELRALDWATALTPPEWREIERQKLQELQATGQPVRYEKEFLRKDGTRVPIELLVNLARDAQGKPDYYYSFISDITERKQAEDAEQRMTAELRQRVAELQAANEEVQASRRAALSLAEDTLEARKEAERVNANLQEANEALGTSRRAAMNLMEDALQARQRAERASAELHSTAEQRRLALEAADLGAWDYHFETGEVFWDERCREMWGIPQAETISYNGAIAAIHPEDRAGVDKAVQEALAGRHGGAYHQEFRVVWPDGSVHWIASHGHVYFHGEGDQRRTARFIGANQDVTDRKEREGELQRLNRTLKAHSKSDQALMRAQAESEYLEAVCRIVVEDCGHAMVWIGFAEEDEGRTVRPAAQAGFEAGYLQTLNITWGDAERGRGPTGTAIRTGQPCMCRNMLTDPRFAPWRAEAIKRGYASSLVLPLLADDRAFGALTIYSRQPDGFGDDEVTLLTELAGDLAYGITALRLRAAKERAEEALRQTEERYRGLVELSPEGLFVNRNDQIVLVNPAALRLFGASGAEQLLGKSPFEVFHPDYHAIMRERISGLFAGQGAPVIEEKIVRLDGVVVDVEVVAAPITDQGEQAILVLLRDITERKRAQAALQQTAADLARSNRDLEQFAYVASHDLQEPLRAVGGYVKLIERHLSGALDARAREFIAGAFDGALRMERLIQDLLAFSRVGTRGGDFVPVNLETVLQRTLANLQTSIQSAQAVITHDALPTLPVDATQMLQVFQNLISNALKFHGGSPPKIHVGVQRQDGRRVFSVRDNGIGIEPQYFERIFQIFQRLHTRKAYSGTGIGLAICKKIVERHGGTIWVESQPGHGSTFFFSIPEAASG